MREKHKDQPKLESKNLILYPLMPEQMQLFKNDTAALCRAFTLIPDDYARDGAMNALIDKQYDKMLADPQYMSFHTIWIIVQREEKHLIGYLHFLDHPSDTGMVEMDGFIKPAYRRKGYMTEAVNVLRGWAFANRDVIMVLAHPAKEDIIFHGLLRKSGFGHWTEHEHSPSEDVEVWCSEKKPTYYVKIGLLLGLGIGVVVGSIFGISRWITALVGGLIGILCCTAIDVKNSRKRYEILKQEQERT